MPLETLLRNEKKENGQCRTPLKTLSTELWNEREENGQCRTPLKTLLWNERKENGQCRTLLENSSVLWNEEGREQPVSDAVETLFLVLWNEKGRERPVSDAVENSSFPGEISEEFGGLNALMNSLLSARSRNGTTVVADLI